MNGIFRAEAFECFDTNVSIKWKIAGPEFIVPEKKTHSTYECLAGEIISVSLNNSSLVDVCRAEKLNEKQFPNEVCEVMIKILSAARVMSLIADWRAYALLMLSLCPFINSQSINQNDHSGGITDRYKIAEKYQLLGGKSDRLEFRVANCLRSSRNHLLMCAITIKYFSLRLRKFSISSDSNLLPVNLMFRWFLYVTSRLQFFSVLLWS